MSMMCVYWWSRFKKLFFNVFPFYERIRELEKNNLILKMENEDLSTALIDDLQKKTIINKMLADGKGALIEFEGGAIHLIAEMLGRQFEQSSAVNYIEMTFTCQYFMPGEHFVLTLQKSSGLTPHQKVIQLEKELAELRAFGNWV